MAWQLNTMEQISSKVGFKMLVILFGSQCVKSVQSWWRHQMETFSALLALCAGNSLVTGEFPSQRASDAELWCFLWSAPCINGWVNNHEAGDLRRHRGHYDVILMYCKLGPHTQSACSSNYDLHVFSATFSLKFQNKHYNAFLAATNQLYKWYFPSVRPSVCHTFLTMFPSSYHHEILRSYYQWPK